MKKFLFLLTIMLTAIFCTNINAQSLPAGTAGLVYTYDAAGNRTKVEYVVNNTTSTVADISKIDTVSLAKKINEQVLKVDALYPNPTTGQITVRLAKPLQNATVQVKDITGRAVINTIANGSVLNYDLTRFVVGVYFLYIQQGVQKVMLKIIKR